MKNKISQSKVSVIITTKNEEKNIKTCLQSIKDQSYQNIEIIVIDNNSSDSTKKIALGFTKHVYNKGPERSAQRNYGAEKSAGDYLLFLDADMKLSKDVVKDCVSVIEKSKVGGVIIPEESYGIGFWAQCKKLERSFYLGIDWIEGARFFNKKVFNEIGAYDAAMISGEDWDLSQRVMKKYSLVRINSFIFHNEGRLLLSETIKKKYYYAKNISPYLKKSYGTIENSRQTSVLGRYQLYFSNYKRLLKNPLLSLGMLFMKTAEFCAGGLAYLLYKQ